jgi:hypothetical protein
VSDTATCGCGMGLVLATPLAITNRPALSAIAYRVGTHPQFKASLLARLAVSDHPALQQLASRRDDDFAIALCDACATVADVLTFYQERIATESYLRTATERRSVTELARLVGYALRPGVAAGTHLAFSLETAVGAPEEVTIDAGTKIMSVPGPGERPQTFETGAALAARGAWNRFRARSMLPGTLPAAQSVALQGASLGLHAGDRVVFVGAGRRASSTSPDWAHRELTEVAVDREHDRTVVSWKDTLPPLGAPVELYVLRQRAALFGHNAPDPRILATRTRALLSEEIDASGKDWKHEQTAPGELDLDATYSGVLGVGWALLRRPGAAALFDVAAAATTSRSAYTLSARVTRLTVAPASATAAFHGGALRGTAAFVQSEPLGLAPVPAVDPVAGSAIELDAPAAGLPAGRLLLVDGIDADTGLPAGEPAVLLRTENDATRLVLNRDLVHRYRPESVIVHGNVSPATHGETVRESIGSGDGSKPFQRMELRQPPITYVSADTPSGAASTLELRVNGLLWREAPTLLDAGPGDRRYVVRHEDDGPPVVEFGDGDHGARLPTGRENVTAVYRKGIGREGLLRAGQLSQLITRPLGVKDAVNPVPTAGAEDPESGDAARRNCTLTIRTLDRVVSLQDYEDFARAFGGIAKALATWFWNGRRRGVFLTVAGPDGAPVPAPSELRTNLLKALRGAGDPRVPIEVHSFVPATAAARVAVAATADARPADVHDRVRAALTARFGFDARDFAQPITLDEVLAVAQSADGVVAANVTALHRPGGAGVESRLDALGPTTSGSALAGAELLMLDPELLELTDLA